MEKKNNKKQIAIIIAGILLVMVLVVSITYAYFTAQATSSEQQVTTGTVKLAYSDPQNNEPYVIAENIKPLVREYAIPRTEEGLLDQESAKAAIKTFTLTNNGTEKLFVDISLDELTLPTDLKRYDFMYALYEGRKNVSNGSFEYMENGTNIMQYLVFEAGESKDYQLCIWIEETNKDQSVMMNEEFSAKITATGSAYWETPAEYFTFDEESGAITGYTNVNEEGQAIVTDISIPSKINNVPVTSINSSAFASKGLTSIIIPDSIESIGLNSFSNNQLTSVVIPNSVVGIGGTAFKNNQLTSVIIPDSINSMTPQIFSNNKLKNIVIPNSVTNIGSRAFYDNKLTSIIIPNSITELQQSVFSENLLTSVIIPNSVTTILHGTFYNNKLTDIIIPNSVTAIAGFAFNKNEMPDSKAFIYARKEDGTIDNTTLIGYGGLNKDITIPSNVVNISANAFEGCDLTNVNIPDSVMNIGALAFTNNADLATITVQGKKSETDFTSVGTDWYGSCTNIIYQQ